MILHIHSPCLSLKIIKKNVVGFQVVQLRLKVEEEKGLQTVKAFLFYFKYIKFNQLAEILLIL